MSSEMFHMGYTALPNIRASSAIAPAKLGRARNPSSQAFTLGQRPSFNPLLQ